MTTDIEDKQVARVRTLVEQSDYLSYNRNIDEGLNFDLLNIDDLIDSKTKFIRDWNDSLFQENMELLRRLMNHKSVEVRSLSDRLINSFFAAFGKNIVLKESIVKLTQLIHILLEQGYDKETEIKKLLNASEKYARKYKFSSNEAASLENLLGSLENKNGFQKYAISGYFRLSINYSKNERFEKVLYILEKMSSLLNTSYKNNEWVDKWRWLTETNLCEIYLVCGELNKAEKLSEMLLAHKMITSEPELTRSTIEFINALAADNLSVLSGIKKAVQNSEPDSKFDWDFTELKFVSNRYGDKDYEKIREVIKAFEKKNEEIRSRQQKSKKSLILKELEESG